MKQLVAALWTMVGFASWAAAVGAQSRGANASSRPIEVVARAGTRMTFDLSPDGQWLVFDLLGQLWRLPITGGLATPLTNAVRDTASDQDPRVSPDSKRILFRRDDIDDGPLFLLSLDTRRVERLANDPWRAPFTGYFQPAWRPGAEEFAAIRFLAGSDGRVGPTLQLVDARTGAAKRINANGLPSGFPQHPTWLPSGDRVALLAGDGDIWEVTLATGLASAITTAGLRARTLAASPDGQSFAIEAPDSSGRHQIWTVMRADGTRRQLTTFTDSTAQNDRAGTRWSPDGRSIYFVRDGRFWTVATTGGPPREVPFEARLSFTRRTVALPSVSVTMPGALQRARGFTGLALARDGRTIAMLALDSLYVLSPNAPPRAIAGTPPTALGLSWSPDARSLVFSAGSPGEGDLYVADVATGQVDAITRLAGDERRAEWSPDGSRIAFVHSQYVGGRTVRTLRLVNASTRGTAALDRTHSLGPLTSAWSNAATVLELIPQWAPDGSALLLRLSQVPGAGQVVSLDSTRRPIWLPPGSSFVRWTSADSIVFIRSNQLRIGRLRPDSTTPDQSQLVGPEAALYPAAAPSGEIVHVSNAGLVLTRRLGERVALGWPITFRAPTPPPTVIANLRLLHPGATEASAPKDVVMRDGRIAAIDTHGATLPAGVDVIDAGGRIAIPGLIDAHFHSPEDAPQRKGALYYGVTSARELGAPMAISGAVRDATDAGAVQGPRLVVGGFQFVPGCTGAFCNTTDREQYTPDDATAVRGLELSGAFGAGVAKMYRPFSLKAGTRFIPLAHRAGLRVTGHFMLSLPFVAAGADGKEHLLGGGSRTEEAVHQDVAQLLLQSGVAISPTVSVFDWFATGSRDSTRLAAADAAPFVSTVSRAGMLGPEYSGSSRPSWLAALDQLNRSISRLTAAGVRFTSGTDYFLPWGIHAEMESLVRGGVRPTDALASATSGAAAALGIAPVAGEIAVGKLADLVILDGDPLIDIRATHQIWRIIKAGALVDRERLAREQR